MSNKYAPKATPNGVDICKPDKKRIKAEIKARKKILNDLQTMAGSGFVYQDPIYLLIGIQIMAIKSLKKELV